MIYIITSGEYSDYHIIAATTDKECAEKIAEHFNADIEEFNDATPRVLEKKHYQYSFAYDGALLRDFVFEIRDYDINTASYVGKNYRNEWVVNVYTDKTKEAADKIAYDLLAEARAKEAGI